MRRIVRFERSALRLALQAHEIGRSFTEPEMAAIELHPLAKTVSRSVLGIVHELTYLAEVYVELDSQSGLSRLSMRLAETPCGPLYERHISPDRELAALVASASG